MNPIELLTTLDTLLTQEATKGPLTGIADLQERLKARVALQAALNDFNTLVTDRQRQFARLPRLPHYAEVVWAQAVLAFPNLAFLEIDTTGLGEDAQIIRVLLVDRQTQVLFDTFIKPSRPLSPQITHLTGIQPEDVQTAPTVREAWPSMLKAFQGYYLLSYNLDFDQRQLTRAAEREAKQGQSFLQPPVLIAECLMQRWMTYQHEHLYPKLATLCQQIGHPLPDHPQQTAYHRACGQVALLQAMAEGQIGVRIAETGVGETPPLAADANTASFDDDDHPF